MFFYFFIITVNVKLLILLVLLKLLLVPLPGLNRVRQVVKFLLKLLLGFQVHRLVLLRLLVVALLGLNRVLQVNYLLKLENLQVGQVVKLQHRLGK